MVRLDHGNHAGARLIVLERLDQLFAVAGAVIFVIGISRLVAKSPTSFGLPLSDAFREDAVLLAMLAYLVAAMTLSTALKVAGVSDDVLTAMVVNNGAQLCGIAGCLALAARRVQGGVPSFVRGARPELLPAERESYAMFGLNLIVIAVGVAPLIRDATTWLILLLKPGFQFAAHPTLAALEKNPSILRMILLWIGAALIAPVAEEVFFRGILQNYVVGAIRKHWAAIVLSAAAFAAVHFSQPHAVPALFFLGLLLGFAFARTGKLYVPVAVHAAFNLKTLLWESLQRVPP